MLEGYGKRRSNFDKRRTEGLGKVVLKENP